MKSIPNQCDVIVIGGGPAGSTTATQLARAGLEVVVLDKVRFPRNTIGESIVPQVWKLADIIGASEKIAREGFIAKAGGIAVWGDRVNNLRFRISAMIGPVSTPNAIFSTISCFGTLQAPARRFSRT